MHIDDRVIFVHIPRTSGTSVRRALLNGKDPNPWICPAEGIGGKHAFGRTARAALTAEVWDSRFKFAVVRNPWDRLVSLYGLFRRPEESRRQKVLQRSRFERGRCRAAAPYKIDKLVHAVSHDSISIKMSKPKKIDLHRLAFGCDFKRWLLWFCDEYRWNACPYLDTDKPMTRIQQVEWVEGLDEVFRFDDRGDLNDCLSDMGYAVPVAENATKHQPWQSYYDDESYGWVAEVFADDIQRFGF